MRSGSAFLCLWSLAWPASVRAGGEPSVTIFLNANGGTYRSSPVDDSRTNESSVLAGAGIDVAIMPPYPYGDASWEAVVSCVQRIFAPFDVAITTEDPGATDHLEVVVAGHYEDIDYDPVGGLASPLGCAGVRNSIPFVFPEVSGDVPERICEVVAHETGHAFGLEHAMRCDDVMTYLADCGPKTFVDADVPCGEYTELECRCSYDRLTEAWTQNSYRILMDLLGPPGSHSSTSVWIEAPTDGDEVAPAFAVTASVEGPVDEVVCRVDSREATMAFDGDAWRLDSTPSGLGPGRVDVTARFAGKDVATDSIRVFRPECETDIDCPGEVCEDGACEPRAARRLRESSGCSTTGIPLVLESSLGALVILGIRRGRARASTRRRESRAPTDEAVGRIDPLLRRVDHS